MISPKNASLKAARIFLRSATGSLGVLAWVNLVLSAGSFITTLYIARTLGIEQFGAVSYAFAIGALVGTLATWGTNRTLVRDLVNSDADKAQIVLSSNLLHVFLIILGMILVLLSELLPSSNSSLGLGGALVVFGSGLNALSIAPVFDSENRISTHSLLRLIERLFYFLLVWLVIWLYPERLTVLTIGLFTLVSVLLGLSLQFRWSPVQLKLAVQRSTFRHALLAARSNQWVVAAAASALVSSVVGKLILGKLGGDAELGIFSAAWLLVTLTSVAATQVVRVSIPTLARIFQDDYPAKARIVFMGKFSAAAVGTGCVVGIPALIFPELFLKLFGEEYVQSSATTAVRIISVYVILLSFSQVITAFLINTFSERTYSINLIVTGAVSIGLLVAFIPGNGAIGASIAVTVAETIYVVLGIVIVSRKLKTIVKQPN